MNRLVTSAALVWAGTAVLLAQTGTGTRAPSAPPPRSQAAGSAVAAAPVRAQGVAPAGAQAPAQAAEAAKHRAWLNKNCVGCHNSRTASPPELPVNLETASLDDLLP